MKTSSTTFFMLFLAIFMFSFLNGGYHIIDPEVVVSGTSTIHDWEVRSTNAKGQATFDIKDRQLKNVSGLTITIPAESLKSGKSGMDNNTYKALKTKNHPDIIFKLKKVNQIHQTGNLAEVEATGDLTVAGETRNVDLQVTCDLQNDQIVIQGMKSLNMTDFNIEPPVALLGTIKTGDAINISFKIKFQTNHS